MNLQQNKIKYYFKQQNRIRWKKNRQEEENVYFLFF